MKIDKINSQAASFQSRFVPNQILEQAIDRATKENDRSFLKAVNIILNDGKDDVVELKQRAPKYISLHVNGKMTEEVNTYLNYYTHACAELLRNYVGKISKDNLNSSQYKNLTQQEKKLISENVDLIKLLSENFESGNNYFEEVQNILKEMKQKLDNNTKQEFEKLKKVIFG